MLISVMAIIILIIDRYMQYNLRISLVYEVFCIRNNLNQILPPSLTSWKTSEKGVCLIISRFIVDSMHNFEIKNFGTCINFYKSCHPCVKFYALKSIMSHFISWKGLVHDLYHILEQILQSWEPVNQIISCE